LKEMGAVENLLSVRDITQIQAKGLSDDAQQQIRDIIANDRADLVSMENPTTTLEDLFLGIVRDSKARPGYNRKRERDQQETVEAVETATGSDETTAETDDAS